jgi:hypothetical protein
MGVKLSLNFEGSERVCGWSETLYMSGTSLSNANTQVLNYIPIRLAIAPSSVSFVGGRMSVIGSPKNSQLIIPPTAHVGTFNSEVHMTEPWSALLMRLQSGAAMKAPRYLHGIPQTQVTGGTFTPTGGFLTALASWSVEMTTNWSIYVVDPANPGPGKQIAAISSAPYVRLTKHPVGRPFGLLVGKRLARA